MFVEGRLQLDQWQTESGERRSRLKVVAQRVTFLGRADRGEAAPAGDGAETSDETSGEAMPAWVTEAQ